jgi:hypothetical protein
MRDFINPASGSDEGDIEVNQVVTDETVGFIGFEVFDRTG